MPQCSQVVPISFWRPEWAMTKLVRSSLIGVCAFMGTPSEAAAHCSQRCFSIFLPLRISVRWTVAGLLQLSHFMADRLTGRAGNGTLALPNRISVEIQRQCKGRGAKKRLRDVRRPVGGGFPDVDAGQADSIREGGGDRASHVKGDVLGRGVELAVEGGEVVEVAVVPGADNFVHEAFEVVEVHDDADRVERGGGDGDADAPVVAVEVFEGAVV